MIELMMSGNKFVESRSTSGLVFNTDLEADIYQSLNVKESAQDILNNWPRATNVTYYATKEDAPAGSVSNWYYDDVRDSFVQPNNTSQMEALISPNKYKNYTFETTLTSTNADDDAIGVVVAADLIDGEYNGLYLSVNAGGGAWLGDYRFNLLFFDKDVPELRTGITVAGNNLLPDHGNGTGWSGKTVKVRVSRSGNMVSAKCSMWNSDIIDDSTELIYNINDLPRKGNRLAGYSRYGYCTRSQAGATYLGYSMNSTDLVDDGVIYSAETDKRWKYGTDSWELTTKQAHEDFLDYDRVTNNLTGDVYDITNNVFVYLRTTGILEQDPPTTLSLLPSQLNSVDIGTMTSYSEPLQVIGVYNVTGLSNVDFVGTTLNITTSTTNGSFVVYVSSADDIDPETGINNKVIRYINVTVNV